jgi:hypothetical protein
MGLPHALQAKFVAAATNKQLPGKQARRDMTAAAAVVVFAAAAAAAAAAEAWWYWEVEGSPLVQVAGLG